jgi:hypothetical protein
MVGALDRLRRGERAGRVLDDRFISGFALAGTAEQVIAQAAQYRRAGADELALSFAGPQPATQQAVHRLDSSDVDNSSCLVQWGLASPESRGDVRDTMPLIQVCRKREFRSWGSVTFNADNRSV